jgi:hypothetical protein
VEILEYSNWRRERDNADCPAGKTRGSGGRRTGYVFSALTKVSVCDRLERAIEGLAVDAEDCDATHRIPAA